MKSKNVNKVMPNKATPMGRCSETNLMSSLLLTTNAPIMICIETTIAANIVRRRNVLILTFAKVAVA